MKYCGIDISDDFENGYVMAVYRTGVEFGTWNGEKLPWSDDTEYNEEDLLEIHVFDEKKEFRAVRSVRENGGFIRNTISDERYSNFETIRNDMLLFGEEWVRADDNGYVVKESGREKKIYLNKSKSDFENGIYLKVVDYYGFNDDKLMYLAGYRMKGVK